MVRLLPIRDATRPSRSAPPKATNCTIRIAAMSVLCASPSCSVAVDRRGVDDGLDAVVVEQVGDQEEQRLGIRPSMSQRLAQLPEAARSRPGCGPVATTATGGRSRRPRNGTSVQSPHQTPAESRLIRTASAVDSPNGSMVTRTRLAASNRPAAEVAERPAPTRHPVPIGLLGDLAEDRVVDDQR